MKIDLELIPHDQQRYETVGDWWLDSAGVLQIRASQMKDRRYSALVILHELVEVLVESLRHSGDLAVPQELVEATDIFDQIYEAQRPAADTLSEPGYSPRCPVYIGHMLASAVEHLAAMLLAVDYNAYQDEIAKLR